MTADLEAVPALPEVVRVVDGPGREPQDLLLQGAQAGELVVVFHILDDIASDPMNSCVSGSKVEIMGNNLPLI